MTIRGTFYYRPGHPKANHYGMVEEHDLEAIPQEPGRTMVLTDLYMDGQATVEGIDIGSRRKRREYMKRTGSLDASDFSVRPRTLRRWPASAACRRSSRFSMPSDS